MSAVATVAAVVSAVAAVGSMAYSMTQGAPEINIPKAEVPAVSASSPRADTGASIKLGSTVKDQRVSGSASKSVAVNSVDVLGGLGAGGGLNL